MNINFSADAQVGEVYLGDVMVTAERLDTRESISGLLCRNVYDEWCIQTITHCIPIDPETVTQFDD